MSDIQTIEQSRELVADSMSAVVLGDKHIQARVNMIQGAIKNIFKKDTHYGVIPGTSKPTLYKPGAEQLLVMFRIAPSEPKTEDLSTGDSIRYRVTRSGVSQVDGRFLGSGVGECSSDEEKYKWRSPVCPEEFEEAAPDRKREVWKKAYGKSEKRKQVRTNPSDLANTILKMADKRAMVAMTLCVTGASDAFSQDLEDLPPEYLDQSAPAVVQPARKSAETPAGSQKPPTMATPAEATPTGGTPPGGKTISLPQAKRFIAISKTAGKSDEEIKGYLVAIGVTRTTEIPSDKYEAACDWAATVKKETVDTTTGEVEQESPLVGQ